MGGNNRPTQRNIVRIIDLTQNQNCVPFGLLYTIRCTLILHHVVPPYYPVSFSLKSKSDASTSIFKSFPKLWYNQFLEELCLNPKCFHYAAIAPYEYSKIIPTLLLQNFNRVTVSFTEICLLLFSKKV